MIRASILKIGIAVLFCATVGCSAKKHTIKKEIKMHAITSTDSSSFTQAETETKVFGDTLRGNSFMSADIDSAEISVQSGGIDLNIKVKPKKNLDGLKVGHDITFNAIAKPKSITNTRQAQQTDVRTTSNKSEQTALVETKTKSGKLGWWVLWLVLLLVVIAFVLFKPLKFLK